MPLIVKVAETKEEIRGLRELRALVFVCEQGVPKDLEIDEFDVDAIHIVGCSDTQVIATGRLVLDTAVTGRIGRMAVLAAYRRSGIGTLILRALEKQAVSRGLKTIILNAQFQVVDFYVSNGYVQTGSPFIEAGIKHIQMTKQLSLFAGTGSE
ncbi:MAG: GNAT family N-acetyltransferase [SAR202 cluster bacterium]|nr:GNAT family N-acetyltransferase [SAR202 cluster bacterium]